MKKKMVIPMLMVAASMLPVVGLAEEKDTNAVVEYESGNLVLNPNNALPDDLNFGSHPIQTTNSEEWLATTDGVQTSPAVTSSIEVSDNRGDESGWVVKLMQMTQFQTTTNVELEDAQLVIAFGAITNNLGLPPTLSTANMDLDVTIGTSSDLIYADEGEGIGETALAIDQFSLEILADTQKVPEQYTAELNWTIEAGE